MVTVAASEEASTSLASVGLSFGAYRIPMTACPERRTAAARCLTGVIAQLNSQLLPQQLQQERRAFSQIDHVEDTASRGPISYLLLQAGNERCGILEGLPIGFCSHRSVLAVSCKYSLLLFKHGQLPGSVPGLHSQLLERLLERVCLRTHGIHLFGSSVGFALAGNLSGDIDRLALLVQLELQWVEPAEQLTDLGLQLQDLGLRLGKALSPLLDALDHFVIGTLLCGQVGAGLRLLAPQLLDGRSRLAGKPRRLEPAGIPVLLLAHKPGLLCSKVLGLFADGNQFLFEPVRVLTRLTES